jgi:hypothetical protein
VTIDNHAGVLKRERPTGGRAIFDADEVLPRKKFAAGGQEVASPEWRAEQTLAAAKRLPRSRPSLFRARSLHPGGIDGRSHTDTRAGCMVDVTVSTRSMQSSSRSISSRSRAEKLSTVLTASYLCR